MISWRKQACVVGAAALGATGCSAGAAEPATGDSEAYVASAASFAGFCGWTSAPATTADAASDGLHGLGPLTVYWNQTPPSHASAFPVGTIIVKANAASDPTARIIFAMVKRGAGFNAAGLAGWEWFSLVQQSAACDAVTILWRGSAPPPGETYAGMPVGDCNGCHAGTGNDGVWDEALQLGNF
jgi:hypothetical protein